LAKHQILHADKKPDYLTGETMSDFYANFANSGVGRVILNAINLPTPQILDRHSVGAPTFKGDILVGGTGNSNAIGTVAAALRGSEANLFITNGNGATNKVQESIGTESGVTAYTPEKEDSQEFKALVFDATGVCNTTELKEVYDFLHPVIRKLQPCARVIILGSTPELCGDRKKQTAQRALEGFSRSVGKEISKGASSALIYIAPGAEVNAESPLRFFLSPKSAYVSGQVIRATKAPYSAVDANKPLTGKTALVTGGSRGIGEAIAETLARDGAKVVVLDIQPMEEELRKVASKISGDHLVADVTAENTADLITEKFREMGGLDILIHNAGVTRDKTLGGMPDHMWDMVMNINLISEENINDRLLTTGTLNENARIVCVSSMSGIAGNFGQTNYAMSKAGVIGMVQSTAKELENGMTINAVAPGFIETQMTAAIPFTIREAGRRMNSMSQGGQPVDVAETIAFFASPASSGINGNVVRVCGQSLLGA
jgi:3-oxoacyl-[acyl-carrier protein] reductase